MALVPRKDIVATTIKIARLMVHSSLVWAPLFGLKSTHHRRVAQVRRAHPATQFHVHFMTIKPRGTPLCKLLETRGHEVAGDNTVGKSCLVRFAKDWCLWTVFTIFSQGVVVVGNGRPQPLPRIPDPACSDRRHPG
jgi:hypothetical protein